ncbi:MAG: MlaD family protein [Fibrobacterota bacterium]
MKAKHTDFIVGFVITLSIAILIFGIIYLKEYNIGREQKTLTALFDDVGTLSEGDPVKINGVKMGKVVTRTLQGNQVLVTMEMDASAFIPEDSRITIQNVGLMGERMIGIRLGKSKVPLDFSRPMQGAFDSGIAEAMGMLGDVFKDAKELVVLVRKLLDETVANEEFLRTFKNVTERLDRLTVTVDRMVTGNAASLNTIVSDVKSTTSDLKGFMDQNKGKLNGMVDNLSETSVKANDLVGKADSLVAKIDRLLGKISSNESAVGQLLNDKELYGTIKSTITEADSLLKSINKTGKLKVKIGF